jgi:uncharacterized protein YciI
MKHFIIEIQYTKSMEKINSLVTEHRSSLQTGYDQGWILMSGPKFLKTGGIIIARSPSLEALREFFTNDPYKLNNCADYKFIEFDPVKRQNFIETWVQGD